VPHLTALIDPRGVVLRVVVAVTAARRAALQAAGQSAPNPESANLLVDTGASMTSLDKVVIQKLGLQPTGSISVNTPSTGTKPHQCSSYDVDILMVTSKGQIKHIPALPVIEADFSAQGHDGLIGRDILADFRMTYSGPDNIVWLSY
jgi:hypothetical protein